MGIRTSSSGLPVKKVARSASLLMARALINQLARQLSLNSPGISRVNQLRKAWILSPAIRELSAHHYAAALLHLATGITFDFNGVILLDGDLQDPINKAIFRKYGIDLPEEEYQEHFFGRPRRLSFPDYFKRHRNPNGLDPALMIEDAKAMYFRKLSEQPIEKITGKGIEDLLLVLTSMYRSKSIAIASMDPRDAIDHGLGLLNLTSYFDPNKIICDEEGIRPKPDPDIYNRTVAFHPRVRSPILVAIEDSPTGVRAAKAAGFYCIAVLTSSKYTDLLNAGADVIIEDLSPLAPILRQASRYPQLVA